MSTPTTSTFRLELLGFSILKEIEGSWTEADFSQLAARLELDDLSGLSAAEVREMCVLALSDLKPAAAAELLLQHRLGDTLGKGQIKNASHEMIEEKPLDSSVPVDPKHYCWPSLG